MRNLYFFLLSIFTISSFAGTGTQINPFTVSQAIAKTDGSSQTYWVKGYIVGEMSDFSNNKYFYELAPPFDGTSAYLIADNPNEIDLKKCMPIQLGTERAATMNLDEFPQYWRKEVLTCGLLRDYFAMPGLKTLSAMDVLTPTPLVDETQAWTFFENMDGSYQAISSSSIFAGGTYTGETGTWKIYGGTYGDSGNDNKWGSASARIRLSEASVGEPGYMQMEFDKPNGIGVVRFWAGYYSTDNGGALSLYASRNQGLSWEPAVASQSIAKDWKEYEFAVNQTGNLRLRIMKAETGSSGINVDKIRISDFSGISGNEELYTQKISYQQFENGIKVNFTKNSNHIRVFSASGQRVFEAESADANIFIPLNKGVYLLMVNQSVQKLICK